MIQFYNMSSVVGKQLAKVDLSFCNHYTWTFCNFFISHLNPRIDLHWSGITLWPLRGEVNNTDYLFIMALVSGWDILGGKWTCCPQSWWVEAWASVRIWVSLTRAKLWWLADWVKSSSVCMYVCQYVAVSIRHWHITCLHVFFCTGNFSLFNFSVRNLLGVEKYQSWKSKTHNLYCNV